MFYNLSVRPQHACGKGRRLLTNLLEPQPNGFPAVVKHLGFPTHTVLRNPNRLLAVVPRAHSC